MENKEPTKEDSEGRPDFGFEYLDHTVRLFFVLFSALPARCLLFMRCQVFFEVCTVSKCLCLNLSIASKLFQITGFEKI